MAKSNVMTNGNENAGCFEAVWEVYSAVGLPMSTRQ